MLHKAIRCTFSITDRLQKFRPPAKIERSIEKAYPKQHPLGIESSDSRILRHDKPLRYLQPRFETPYEIYKVEQREIDQPANARRLEVAIVGAPNAGKSSLMNSIVNSRISSVSNKANTTHECIVGIHTRKETQLMIYDTPGITKQYAHSKHYVTRAWDILSEVDKAIVLVDAVKTLDDRLREALRRLNKLSYNEEVNAKIHGITELDRDDLLYGDKLSQILSKDHTKNAQDLSTSSFPKILVLNKMDLCTNKKKLNWLVSEIEDLAKFEHKFFISTMTGYGIPQLIDYLESEAQLGKWKRHSEVKSDFSKVEIIEQIIKSAIFSRYFHELPYQIGVTLSGEFFYIVYVFEKKNSQLEVMDLSNSTLTSMQIQNHKRKLSLVNERNVSITMNLLFAGFEQVNSVSYSLIGHKGRNVIELISATKIELIKLFQKEFEITVKIKLRKEGLLRENSKVEEVTPDNFGNQQAENILKTAERERKRIILQLDQFLSYPLLN